LNVERLNKPEVYVKKSMGGTSDWQTCIGKSCDLKPDQNQNEPLNPHEHQIMGFIIQRHYTLEHLPIL